MLCVNVPLWTGMYEATSSALANGSGEKIELALRATQLYYISWHGQHQHQLS